MSETLRPSTLGEILDRTAQLYRRNFWLFAGIGALPIGTMFAIVALCGVAGVAAAATVGTTNLTNPTSIVLIALLVVVAVPIYIAAGIFSYAGLTQAAASTHRGEKVTIRGALASVRPRFWRYLWFIVLQGIVVALIPAAAVAVVVLPLIWLVSRLGDYGLGIGALIGFLVFVLIASAIGVIIWRALGYSIGLAVCVAEQRTAWQSLQRAWKLTQGSKGRILVLFLLMFALSIAASMIGYIPFLIIVGVSTAAGGNDPQYATTALVVAEIANFVVNFTLQALLAPISWIALVLFYYDQRIRKEGFDIEWMMEKAGLAQLASAAPAPESAGVSGPAAPPDTVEER